MTSRPAPLPAAGSILDLRHLTVRRDKQAILDGIDWKVRTSEHWVILGANGSGKTSLLSALTGYLTPTDGEIEVLGRSYGQSDWRELRTAIGIVSSSIRQMMHDDETALNAVISGKYAMVQLWGKVKKADRVRALELLHQVDVAYLAHRAWVFLSQGERQRVLIARAMMADLRLLILDEPCAGLDPVSREHFLHFLDRLGRQPGAPTLVLVTHHVEEIMPVFSHVLVLERGKVLATGPVTETLRSPVLAQAFGAAVKLSRAKSGRYALAVPAVGSRMM